MSRTEKVWSVVGCLGAFVLVFLLAYFGLGMKRFFAPRHAQVDREVFEQTPSFVHGKAQYLSRLRFQYEIADTETSKASLRTLILSEAAAIDRKLLPVELQAFLLNLE